MEPGIYQHIRMAEYRLIDAVNCSSLKKLKAECPFNARAELLNPSPPSTAMALGTALHAWTLERDVYGDLVYVTEFQHTAQSKAGKMEREDADKMCGNRVMLSDDDDKLVKAMSKAIVTHPIGRKLAMSKGEVEEVVIWIDEATGMKCKAKLDKRIGSVVIDIKSTKADSRVEFEKEVEKFEYHVQAAFYSLGLAAHGIQPVEFYFIPVCNEAVEKVEGRGKLRYAEVHQLGQESLRIGEEVARERLNAWHHYTTTSNWPAFSPRVEFIDIPMWAIKAHDRNKQEQTV